MSIKHERATRSAADEEETASDPEQSSASAASAAEASSSAAAAVDAIGDVLDEFDDLTLGELGLRKDEDPDMMDEAIAKGRVEKGGQ